MPLGPGLQFSGVTAYIAVSPDERVVTFSARKGVGVEQQSSGGGDLYVRRLDRATPVSLEHKGAAQFFSPDGEWPGFFDDGTLMKIPVSGGAAVPIASVGEGQGQWAQGDVIVFSQAGDRPSHGIRRVQASGGDPAAITTLDRTAGHTHHLAPQLLPGGKHVLYTIRSDGPRYELAVVPIEGGSSRVIARDAAYGRYLGDGLLVYQKGDSLFASRLDPTEFRVSGERPVLDGVLFFPNAPAWDIAGGTLVYRAREDDGRTLLWVNRDGSAAPVGAPRKAYWNIRLSPRGDRIAAHMFDGWLTDVWTYDLGPRRLQQVTTDGISRAPTWSPDGSRLLVNQRAAIANVVAVRLDGRGAPEALTHTGQSGGAAFMTRDERFLVTSEIDPVTGYDLMLFDLKTPGPPSVLVRTPKLDAGGKLHPSGRWVAYASTVTGRDDVFVTPFPAGGTRIPVTIDGGREPVWSIDGRELFYRQGNRMFSVAVRAGAELTLDPPRLLFDVPYFQGGGPGNTQYDVASDGRFLMMKAPERETPSLQVVLNWTEALRKAVGGS
jgi:serine/threonine-protein kinase